MSGTIKKRTDYPVPPLLGEQTAAVHINVAEIPDHVRDDLAAATLDFILDILRQSGGRAMLDTKIKEKEAAFISPK